MSYKQQKHIFQQINFGGNKPKIIPIDCFINFPVKKINFDFAYKIVSDQFPAITVSSSVINNDTCGFLNKYVKSGVIEAKITPANFASAQIPNTNRIDIPSNLRVNLIDAGYFPFGTTAYITPVDWAFGDIRSAVSPLTANNNIPITLVPPQAYQGVLLVYNVQAYITPAQLLAANIPTNVSPLVSPGNIQCSVEFPDGTIRTDYLEITKADFDALNISNQGQIQTTRNIPISLIDTVNNNTVLSNNGSIDTYISALDFINSNIPPNLVGNLTVGGNIPGTSNGSIQLVLPQANFNAANISGANNPLTLAADMDLTINGDADLDITYYFDGFSKDKEFSYIFKDPVSIPQQVFLTFRDLYASTNTIIFADIVVHMEFLG